MLYILITIALVMALILTILGYVVFRHHRAQVAAQEAASRERKAQQTVPPTIQQKPRSFALQRDYSSLQGQEASTLPHQGEIFAVAPLDSDNWANVPLSPERVIAQNGTTINTSALERARSATRLPQAQERV